MGRALVAAALLMILSQLNLLPGGGELLRLEGTRLAVAMAGNFVLGALMKVDWRASLGLSLGGLPAILIAAFIVGSLPLTAVRWLVIVVVIYTAATMLKPGLVGEAKVTALAKGVGAP